MTKINTESEAQELLKHVRSEIGLYGLLFMGNRVSNAQTLIDLNLTTLDVRRLIDSLTSKDYFSGPDEDEKYPWKVVAVFGKAYSGTELYIKLSLGFDGTPVVCLSFHAAAFPMAYQFK